MEEEGRVPPPRPPPPLEQSPFSSLSRSAYQTTARAQTLDLQGDSEAAFKAYEEALNLIDKALSLPPCEQEDNLAFKLKNSRKEILERVSDLQHRHFSVRPPVSMETRAADLPPAYQDIGGDPVAMELDTTLNEIAEENGVTLAGSPLPLNAREVFSIPSEVQIYFISREDSVSAPSYPSFLRLVRMGHSDSACSSALGPSPSIPAFLQVGEWTYPLIPGHSPLFRSSDGIYIFPDLSDSGNAYVGLILPAEVGSEIKKEFEDCLLALVGLPEFPIPVPAGTTIITTPAKEKPPRPPAPVTAGKDEEEEEEGETEDRLAGERKMSSKIAEGLISGAEAVSRGLIFGATKTTTFIDRGAAYIQSRMEPNKEKQHIKPEVKQGVKTAKYVTGKAVQVSGFVVTQLGRATLALGRHMAPHVHKASTKFLARTVATDETDANQKVDQVLEVTTGAVVGIGTVYLGLESAAKTLAMSLANNTVNIVQHKYGDEAGELATDTAGTAGNAALTALNMKHLAPKAMAKKVVKQTGKAIVKAHQEKRGDPEKLVKKE